MQEEESKNLDPEQGPPEESFKDETSTSEIDQGEVEAARTELPAEDVAPNKLKRLINWLSNHKKLSIPIAVVLAVLLLAAVPWSRYHLAGPFIKKDLTIKITDATADIPVSGVLVSSDGQRSLTDANGIARLHLSVGKHNLSISKRYYSGDQVTTTLPITGNKSISLVLVATGRQVGVNVKDLLSGQPLSSVEIDVAGVSVTTDQTGKALLVLPAGATVQQAVLSRAGYDQLKANISISAKQIEQNNFTLTPAGKIYFLSNRTGKLNVMKANLDGTSAEVVVAASGYEEADSSAFSESPDGRYVVLETRRSANDKEPQLYVLSTADDRLLTLDSGNFKFSIVGWMGDNLVYKSINNDAAQWQAGKEKIKSYDAASGKTTTLDSTAGSDADKSAGETYGNIYLTSKKVAFDKYWYSNGTDTLEGRKNIIVSVEQNGQNKQVAASYDASTTNEYVYQYAPNSFYIQTYNVGGDSSDANYFDFTVGGSFKKINKPSNNQLYNNPFYLLSPHGDQTYWSESRDGKQTLITADAYGSGGSQKVQAVGYSAAGWYTDNYLLATNKDQDELYVMSLGGQKPIKVADYQSTYVY